MTAIAEREKKKKKDEMYFRYNTGRGIGICKSRMGEYKDAIGLFTTAVENVEPDTGRELPLMIARTRAHTRLVDHDAALADAFDVLKAFPDDIRGEHNLAHTLYERDDFEDALVRHYRGLRKRKKPDYFYNGILVGKETIEDCVGRNAGPCLDHDRLGHVIVEQHMQSQQRQQEEGELKQAVRRLEKNRIDRLLSQKYLGRIAADKQFLIDTLRLPDLKFGNKENNRKLEELLAGLLQVLEREQETLMTQRPLYMLKHHEPKFSPKYRLQKRLEENSWRKGVLKVIDQLMEKASGLQAARDIHACMDVCTRIMRFVQCQSRSLLVDSSRHYVLDRLYSLVARLYMDTKTLVPGWSEADNDRRIEYILHSRTDDKRFVDRVEPTYFPRMWNVKETKKDLESRLSVSTNKMERTFLHHEIARCLLEEGSIERAYKAASTAFKLSKQLTDNMWAFNSGFLSALSVLLEGNLDDAKIGLTEAMINARKLERDDCSMFIQKAIKIAAEPDRLNHRPPDPTVARTREILCIMPTLELRAKASQALHRVDSAPQRAKLPLQPGATLKVVNQSTSRRSIKATTRAKRRTLIEAKNSRYPNLSTPGNAGLVSDDY